MAGIADYFCGTVSISKFAQIVNLETIPVGYTDADGFHQTGLQRNLYTGTYTEKRFYFEGVPVSIANDLPSSATITDIDGSTHTVSFTPSVSDGSSGTAVFENYNNAVTVSKMSPHLRTVEVVERTGVLSCTTT